jgi:hypothetical protein
MYYLQKMQLGSAAVVAIVVAAAVAMAPPGAGKEPAAPCAATTVHYAATRVGTPWIAVGRAFTGNVFYYSEISGDGRVNQSDGLVAYAGVPGKVLWVPRNRRRAGATLVITARRLDGDGAFTQRLRAVPGRQFPSQLELPAAGCWRLTLRSGRLSSSVVVQAVSPSGGSPCDATPVFRQDPPHPRFGRIMWMQATPRSEGVAAIRFVSVVPGADRALIYAGGRAPEGWNTKFLWWAPHPTGALTLTGRRLDGVGRFVQHEGSASSDDGIVFPSIVEIPTAGCWAVTVSMGKTAGLVVFQAVVT